MTTGEFAFIDWLRQRTPRTERVLLGPGDDTAILRWPSGPNCLLTTDMLLEGSCFRLVPPLIPPQNGGGIEGGAPGAGTARQIGRKAMAVNLSDIAAMAGVPVAAVVSVGLPRKGGRALAEELYLGLREMADAFDTAIVGGDTNSWDGPLVINVALLGEATPRGAVRRKGARVGDRLLTTGSLGGSLLGKHLDFTPRVREALALHAAVDLHAMIDISDGLAADVAHLCSESDCGAVLYADAIPIAEAARNMNDGRAPLEHALGDGEDFELVFAVAPADAEVLLRTPPISGLTVLGECVAERGLWLEENGQRGPLSPLGYVHTLE
ncbi:MAG: thiamine-phosphate kinase [Gemmataceae bacterium]